MTDEAGEIRREVIGKAADAQSLYWTSVGTMFGFLLACTTLLASIDKEINRAAIGWLAISNLIGMASVVLCFLFRFKYYVMLYTMILPQSLKDILSSGVEEAQEKVKKKGKGMSSTIQNLEPIMGLLALINITILCILFVIFINS